MIGLLEALFRPLLSIGTDPIDKGRREGECRLCGVTRLAEVLDLTGDGLAISAIPLCAHCADAYRRGEASLSDELTLAEELHAVEVLGGIEPARRRINPLDYHRAVEDGRQSVEDSIK